ncbi:MAG TPA: Ig-like domain-containing protein, partial [Ohtaekwangia sp.]
MATPDFATTGENEPISFNITGNDIPLVGDIDPQTVDLDISLGGTQTSTSTTDGNYSIDASGELTFVPNTGYNGITTLQYTVEDEGGNVVLLPGLITITVTPNNPPSANNDNTSTNEEVAVSITVVTNDSDPEGGLDPATVDLNTSSVGIQNTNTTGAGSWSVNNAGTVLFTPVTDYSGNAQLSYTVNDDIGQTSNTATITITVNNINDTPVANDDAATTSEETPVNVNVLTNDTDPDGNGTINVATVDLDITAGGIQTTNTTDDGVWSVASGVVTFTPESDFTGPTSLDYTVNDNAGATSNAATISITVSNSNDPPVAVDDATTTTEETLVTLNVVSNDTDPDGNGTINAATVDLNTTTGGIQNTASSNGSWSVNSSGVVSFTPALNFTGPATLDYTVNDNAGATSSVGTITINVTNTNDPPEAVDDATTTTEETLVTINVVTNDTDPDGNGTINAATVDLNTTTGGIQNTASSNGSWSVNSSGVVSFTPALNFTGPATLDYTVNDNAGATSSVGTITINVSNTNDPPVAVNDATTTLEDNPVNITVVSNDTDIDGTINIASVDLNTSTGGIQNSASNDDGVFSVNSMGVVTFTPDQDFNGQTTLNYTVNDNSGATSNIATITINVTANNDSPFAVADATTTPEETTVTLNVVANDTDPDGNGTINAATVDLNTSTGGIQNTASNGAGSWSVDASGVVTFTPANNFTGSGSLTYTVNDNGGLTSNQATISITVTPINDPPEAVNDAASGTEDNPVSLNVVTNDTDEEGTVRANSVDLNTGTPGIQNSIVVSGVGTFTVNGSGLVTFTPVLNFNGPASITYTVEDNAGATSNAATITITLSPVNDIPDAVDDVTTTSEETAVTINVLTNDSDADDGINTASVDLNTSTAGIQTTNTTGAGTWSVSGGIVTFTPASNYSGPASLNYTISDMSGATATPASISVTVTPTNDPPTAVNDAASTNEGNAITVNVVSNDTDPEGNGTINAATVDLNTATAGIQNSITTDDGSWTVNSSGVVTFTPVSEFNGPTSITYTVNDNSGATSGTATITITVNPVNDPPVAVADAATTNEETSVTIDVTDNDSDIDGTINVGTVDLNTSSGGIQNSITIASVGTFSVNTAGIVTFTPVANFNGTATVNYTVNDNSGATSNQVAISVTVNATNDPPSAVNDAVTTNE